MQQDWRKGRNRWKAVNCMTRHVTVKIPEAQCIPVSQNEMNAIGEERKRWRLPRHANKYSISMKIERRRAYDNENLCMAPQSALPHLNIWRAMKPFKHNSESLANSTSRHAILALSRPALQILTEINYGQSMHRKRKGRMEFRKSSTRELSI